VETFSAPDQLGGFHLRMWRKKGATYTHAGPRKISLTKKEKTRRRRHRLLLFCFSRSFFCFCFYFFKIARVRSLATGIALWCDGGGIGREIEPPQLRISSYPSSWNKLLTSTFGSLSNFSFIRTFPPQHGGAHCTLRSSSSTSLFLHTH
jgi:hypothetical protein